MSKMDRLTSHLTVMCAKTNFFKCGGGSNADFWKEIGATPEQYNEYLKRGLLIVSDETYRKLHILGSPRAPYFRALFKMIDLEDDNAVGE